MSHSSSSPGLLTGFGAGVAGVEPQSSTAVEVLLLVVLELPQEVLAFFLQLGHLQPEPPQELETVFLEAQPPAELLEPPRLP